MCRLFGVIARKPVDAAYYIKCAPQSLVAQSQADPKRLQADGWGFGWFSSSQPRIEKNPKPLYRDTVRVDRAIRKAKGSVLVGHVRWASNPLRLSRKELIGPTHTQPFSHGGWLFAHNGTLYIPEEVKAELGPWARYVKGRNDSEVFFYWLLKTVIHGKGAGWATRIRASLKGLDRIWQSCKMQYSIYKHPAHGLNWVLTNGKVLLAFCYVNSNGFNKSKAFYDPQQPYFQLQMKATPGEVVIASEPMAKEPGWQPFRHGELVVARRSAAKINVQRIQVL